MSDKAIKFLVSDRGKYIMAQALYYGIKELEAVEPAYMRENSNIEDMKFIRDEMFDFPSELFDNEKMRAVMEKHEEEAKTGEKT